jgi:hypothetical protein
MQTSLKLPNLSSASSAIKHHDNMNSRVVLNGFERKKETTLILYYSYFITIFLNIYIHHHQWKYGSSKGRDCAPTEACLPSSLLPGVLAVFIIKLSVPEV